ncbi:hypothetical protein AKJ49_00600 [candidate division MSBL1 archaeon SCGC-AAA382A03]|uniref:Uncharacterized protein n=1 Tax=candidate division MSBL1 archaeon SCGC-AAA382A03 TaxID=1698278 RepID=A0A133VGG4_9EURY|nr:hypothetical protein AKJ49_00600 [candidate division MSBL1 archaeon SCGC-AAA382A03]
MFSVFLEGVAADGLDPSPLPSRFLPETGVPLCSRRFTFTMRAERKGRLSSPVSPPQKGEREGERGK